MDRVRGPVVIAGASGFVGRHVRRALSASAAEIVVVSRSTAALEPGERLAQGDLQDPATLAERLPVGATVINLAYDPHAAHEGNLRLARGLADLCRDTQAARLVHVSTAMVVGLTREREVTESTTCRPVTPYQRTKLAVEDQLHEALRGICPVVVLRPSAVFGSGGLNLEKLVADLRTRTWYENYARACLFAARPMNLVPVETVAASVVFAAAADRAVDDGLYLVADDEAPCNNFRDVEAVIRRELHLSAYPLPRVPLPTALLAATLKAARRLSFDPRTRFSSARLHAAGFVRPVTFDDALVAYAVRRAGEGG